MHANDYASVLKSKRPEVWPLDIPKPWSLLKLVGMIVMQTSTTDKFSSHWMRFGASFCHYVLYFCTVAVAAATSEWILSVTTFCLIYPCVPQKCPRLYFLNNCQKLTDFNNFLCVTSWENLAWNLTDLSTSPVRCSHFTLGNPKVIFQHYYSYTLDLYTLPQKKTSSNCCTAAIAVYLLLFSASYYLHSPSTASGACYRRSTCIDMLRLVAAACCDMGWISAERGVLCNWSVSKRLEACINAEGGHSEHLLWHCLPDIPGMSGKQCHNRFFSEPPKTTHNWLFSEPPTFERTQQTFSQMK